MAPCKSAPPIYVPDMSAWPIIGCAPHDPDINTAHTGCQHAARGGDRWADTPQAAPLKCITRLAQVGCI